MFNNFILRIIKGSYKFLPEIEAKDWATRVLFGFRDSDLGIAGMLTVLDKLVVGK